MGGSFGTITAWPLVGILIETIGWTYSFYVSAILVGVFTTLWIFIVFDAPAKHPRIKVSEKEYIEQKLVGITESKKVNSSILKSDCYY